MKLLEILLSEDIFRLSKKKIRSAWPSWVKQIIGELTEENPRKFHVSYKIVGGSNIKV